MKQLLLLYFSILSMQSATAQTSHPPKEMVEQIIALKTFFNYTKQGYKIVSGGLRAVNRIKNGDFKLHDLQFDHLQQVSPFVSRSAALSGIAGKQLSLIIRCNRLLQQTDQNKVLTKDERNFCRNVVIQLLDECKHTGSELIQLLTVNEFALKDNERLNRLMQLLQRTIQIETSVLSLSDEVRMLSVSRSNEQRSVQLSNTLNNLQ